MSAPWRTAVAALAAILIASGSSVAGSRPGGSPERLTRSCGNESLVGARLGSIAFLRDGELRLVDLSDCRERLLARGARAPVRFSPDGRWIAFGAAEVVPAAGGIVRRPFGSAVAAASHGWTWLEGDRLAAVTRSGGLVVGGPGRPMRRVLRDGWGAGEVVAGPPGSLVVARAGPASTPRGIWSLLGPNLVPAQRLAVRAAGVTPRLVGAPGARSVLFWSAPSSALSLAADGLPLRALGASTRPLARTLLHDDFVRWCDGRLIVTAGGDRYATRNKRLLAISPPARAENRWRTRELSRDTSRSWVSPVCSPSAAIVAAAAGPNRTMRRFGEERRSIWLLSLDGRERRRLTSPPAGKTDEAPRWTADGKAILFVRSGPTTNEATARGELYAVPRTGGRPLGPLAHVGPTGNYYGHYRWADALDWHAR